MLSSLQIENVAVIQKAEVHFKPGLNVLTADYVIHDAQLLLFWI